MRAGKLLIGLAGLVVAVLLIVQEGAGSIAHAIVAAGWGLVVIICFETVPLLLKSIAWSALFSQRETVGLPTVLLARWIRQSVSQLLPVAQVGGDAVGARVLFLRGVPGDTAGASTVVDLTFGAVAQIIVTVASLVALVGLYGETTFLWPILVGAGVISLCLTGFVFVQRKGLFGYLARLGSAMSDRLGRLAGDARELDAAVARVYTRPVILVRNFVWQTLAQTIACGEIVLACHFLGHPVTVLDAFILQSLVRGMRAAAFFVPGGLGVQEGGLMVLAGFIGLTPATGLAIALVKRVRELSVGVPGLLAWTMLEAQRQPKTS